ncbi:Predicted dienelactone hydrolase [Serratia entomophila]|uniref:alpha/beta hydrolase n=1 Tax=Serratia entomophila TaxID=42906 RepID=UPI00217B9611|nr:alpha/beta hydrolase [Serratia entomophila]CAI1114978.1 Predicted dienelactone hydrolase [Serratia entomophila]CAI1951610.1 Predicted dienelactone hydrolase [Serratia entomophila]
MNVVTRHVRLPFLEDALALRVYTRQETREMACCWPAPVIVLCHGFGGVQEVLLPEVAQAFARDGFVAVTFDYRGFGGSSGERGRLTVARQQEDIRVVLRWICNNPVLDERRVGLWGTGLGGGHALCVAYRNPQVRCVVSQSPILNGRVLITQGMSGEERQVFLRGLEERALRRRIDGEELWVSVNRLIQDRASRQFFHLQRRASPSPGVVNRMPYLTLRELCHYRVAPFARGVQQPALLVTSEHDHLTSLAEVREVYDALAGVRSLVRVPGARHYDLYRAPWRDEALLAQRAWLQAHL